MGLATGPRLLAGAALLLALAGAGCSPQPPEVEAPTPDAAGRQTCAAFLDALPRELAGIEGTVDEGRLVATWGTRDAVVVRCGVDRPAGLEATSRCDVVNEVGWFTEPLDDGYRFTTIGRAAHVEVTVPHAHAPEADVLVDLTEAVRTVPEVKPCV